MSCSRSGCSEAGSWSPVLGLRAAFGDHETMARMPARLVCETHKNILGLADFLGEEGWTKIVRHMRQAGKIAPTKNLTRLTWEEADRKQRTVGSEQKNSGPAACYSKETQDHAQ